MLFLGIDQHARQLTVSLRDQSGEAILARQVSTQPEKILEFLDQLPRRCAQREEQFIAVVGVCGFNDWLIRMLGLYRCHKVICVSIGRVQTAPHMLRRCPSPEDRLVLCSELIVSLGCSLGKPNFDRTDYR